MAKVAQSAAAYLALGAYRFICSCSAASATVALLAALFVQARPALAQDCKPLQMAASLALTPVGDRDPRFNMPVTVNGQEEPFLFDTGGSLPQISSDLADRLKLSRHQADVQMYGVGGERSDYYVLVNFAIGRVVNAHDAPIMLSSHQSIFTPIFMNGFDFDFDAINRKLNILSGDHCPGKVIYWPYKVATAVPYVVRDSHIVVPVTIDGHEFSADIDTGAASSVMRLDVAKRTFGLAPDSAGMMAVGLLGDDKTNVVYTYPFKTMIFGDIAVTNPKIAILPDIVAKDADKEWSYFGGHITVPPENLKLSQVIVGMDVLRKLHIYFAQKEKKLYITEAAEAPATGAPAP